MRDDEAELFCDLRLQPETAGQLAERTGQELRMAKAIEGYGTRLNIVYPLAESYEFIGMEGPAV